MAEPPHLVETDPDFEPLPRPRSCTWPLPRPEFTEPGSSSTSSPAPSVKQEQGSNVDFINNLSLLEEADDYAEERPISLCQEKCGHRLPQQHHHPQPNPQLPHQQQVAPLSSPAAAAQRKGSSSRRNAWGNMSYADLITKAIESSPEKRLTLSQIYDWMVKSVPYFKDKGDSNSSAGWKNSIRHNLSLHSRFVRMQNEGTGKSSWWMLNPEGGRSGKSPRRRAASMDNNSKFAKSRGRAAKKKVSLQGTAEMAADSPSSQYSKWMGSPNSHSNDDFETWTTFRTRASSDASTLSGRRSPFLPEQDDLSEGGDLHLGYTTPAGPKMNAPLPSLSEVTGSLGHHGSENVMMESLLDNLNLISPKNQPQSCQDSSHSAQTSPMMQSSPAYSPYPSPSMGSQAQPQQDYRKCLYPQAGLSSLSPIPMQSLSDTKPGPAGFGPFFGQYNCPPGLLKELLSSDADSHSGLASVETVVTQAGGVRGRLLPNYSGPGQVGAKIMSPHSHAHSSHPHSHPRQIHPSTGMNGCLLPPLGHTVLPRSLSSLKAHIQLGHSQPSAHLGGASQAYCPNGNGFIRIGHPQHIHHHTERLPSDLDDMSIERLECDMESVLHETLMDGDSLDFNFDPVGPSQGFVHGVKTTTHSWVSG
ncbi:forkhead box protein O1-B [Denticeps clupeoides]|uniref:Fork-head domain-containing protein n=1 Tax=Denticeps clupeoides TaxID=299321 RepID=A0AAY4AHY0_9TELE|nr:forkhead box protein O1-B-like [Denticeps clupeoides]